MRFFLSAAGAKIIAKRLLGEPLSVVEKTLHSLSSRNREKVVAQIWKQYHLAS